MLIPSAGTNSGINQFRQFSTWMWDGTCCEYTRRQVKKTSTHQQTDEGTAHDNADTANQFPSGRYVAHCNNSVIGVGNPSANYQTLITAADLVSITLKFGLYVTGKRVHWSDDKFCFSLHNSSSRHWMQREQDKAVDSFLCGKDLPNVWWSSYDMESPF